MYYCDKCDFQATQNGYLNQHKESKHECGSYNCDQCNFQAKLKSYLT